MIYGALHCFRETPPCIVSSPYFSALFSHLPSSVRLAPSHVTHGRRETVHEKSPKNHAPHRWWRPRRRGLERAKRTSRTFRVLSSSTPRVGLTAAGANGTENQIQPLATLTNSEVFPRIATHREIRDRNKSRVEKNDSYKGKMVPGYKRKINSGADTTIAERAGPVSLRINY